MGLDIAGHIECRGPGWRPTEDSDPWRPAMDLDLLYDTRDYDAFGCLFGVRNHANFRPLAPSRGLPPDASDTVRARVAEWTPQGTTWITWDEISSVDWDEPAERPDGRIHQYERRPDGTLEYVTKYSWSADFRAASGVGLDEILGGHRTYPDESEWTSGTTVYRAERLRRRDAVGPAWQPVWTVMETLAARVGGGNVRLIVWFD